MKCLKGWQLFIKAALTIILVNFTCLAQADDIIAPSGEVYQVPQGPDSLIASDTFYIGGIAGNDYPTVKVYGGGRVEVYYPAYMARSGNYELQLNDADLNSLINSLVVNGLLEFDAAQVQTDVAGLKAQLRAQGGLHHVSDPSTTVTDLHLESRGTNRKVNNSVRWTGLKADLRAHPGQADLQGLAAARESLGALADHPGLAKIEKGNGNE